MSASKHIWIVNPFDQLPNESDIPLRFWSLSKVLAKEGYKVTWWSSDFSHRNKIKRLHCPDTDGFSIRLIKTPPYKNNTSLSRLKSHFIFSNNFYREAISKFEDKTLSKPFRIVVSLPPLGLAESAYKIKQYINERIKNRNENYNNLSCQVIIDIMDVWPEVFYRLFPEKIKNYIAPILLYSFHHSAKVAYKKADKISAVSRGYLKVAKNYLSTSQKILFRPKILRREETSKPMHLCYHGVDLSRFKPEKIKNRLIKYDKFIKKLKLIKSEKYRSAVVDQINLKLVYIGAMNSGYDLKTIIRVLEKWKNNNQISLEVHFAGNGNQLKNLKIISKNLGLLEDNENKIRKYKIIFHQYLNNDELNNLLITSDIALVANRPETLVACPYKAGEYAGAGLPMISCLDGEFNKLILSWDAGLIYKQDCVQSLYNSIKKYADNFTLLKKHNLNSRKLAENLFDRKKTYKNFAKFITNDI